MPLFGNPNSRYHISDLSQVGTRVSPSQADAVNLEDSSHSTFDVIIVGGGTSGCVLASRLSEDPSISVLLLEAGGSGQSNIFTRIPAAYSLLFWGAKRVFQLYAEPQDNTRGRKLFWPRAKMLGGCSSINAEMAQYGAPGDFDEWAKITGDESWSWKNFSTYFRKFESYKPHPSQPNVDLTGKGTHGPVKVGYFSHVAPSTKAFVEACQNLKMPFSTDFNQLVGARGVNTLMTYIDENGERVSSESAYLTKDVLQRPNLKVVTHALVTRVLFEKQDGETRAVGVEFGKNKDGPRFRSRSRKEVILSAGAVHSPHILLLSGVGPEKQLKEHDIPVVHDLPGVGGNLVDHPVVDFYFKDKSKTAASYLKPHSLWDLCRYAACAVHYLFTRRGPLTGNWGEGAAFCRSDDPTLFPAEEYSADTTTKIQDSTSSSESPDLEIITTALAYKNHGRVTWSTPTFAVHVCLLRPLSRGTIALRSNSPWDDPIITPNYLQSKDDLTKLVRGSRLCLKVAHTEPLASFVDWGYKGKDASTFDMDPKPKSDEEMEEIVRTRLETLYHPACSCRMAPREQGGALDSQMRVYGIQGLRVCDASVFPSIVSGHTAGACFAVGERLSSILKTQLGQKEK